MQYEKMSDCLDPFIDLCKKSNLKITPQRCAIYRKIMRAKDHPTADELYQAVKKEFPNISYDTVNRTLLTFAEIGLIDVIPTEGGPRRFDPNTDNHHHFHCIGCGEIVDFTNEQFDNLEIPDQILNGFAVYTKRIVLNGLCKNCQKKKSHKDRGIATHNKKH
jgi:Fur family peroxide stress response transcriptional regulator